MNKYALLFILTFPALANAWTIDNIGEYKFNLISDNVYVMHGPLADPSVDNYGFMNNPGLIVGGNGVIVVDPGSSYYVGKKVIEEIESITKKPIVAVFNTHIHGDHWLGNHAILDKYPRVIIYAHPQMISQSIDGEGDVWLRIMDTMTEGISSDTIAVYPTNATSHLEYIEIDTEKFIIHNPTNKAHTNTDIMIEHLGSKTLFLGDNDTVNRFGRFDTTSDMHSSIEVLKYAMNLNTNNYVPGHGPSGNAVDTVEPLLDYLLAVKDVVSTGYEEDLADFEIKPIAVNRLDNYINWSGFKEQIGLHVNKMFLEVENLDF